MNPYQTMNYNRLHSDISILSEETVRHIDISVQAE